VSAEQMGFVRERKKKRMVERVDW